MKTARILSLFLALLLGLGQASLVRGEELAPATAGHTLSQDGLQQQLHDALVSHFNLSGELQLDLLRPWVAPAPTAAGYSLEVVEFPAQLANNVLLRVRLTSEGRSLPELVLPLRLQLWKDAVATREPANRDDSFDIGSMELRRVDALRERDAVYVASLDGAYTFTRSVPAGRLIGWHDLGRRTLVRKGDLVEVNAVDGALSITMKGMALQNGAEGEMVAVRNIESRRDIRAQVVGEKRVQVRF
jgi:flagella basal body P-ring formation protein FlgA